MAWPRGLWRGNEPSAFRCRRLPVWALLLLVPLLAACGTLAPTEREPVIPGPFENYDSARPATFRPPPDPGRAASKGGEPRDPEASDAENGLPRGDLAR